MKITNITDTARFFEVLDKCKGRVELVTSEGDRLNLRSKLCQYVAISKIFGDATIPEIEIICSEPEDTALLLQYMVRG